MSEKLQELIRNAEFIQKSFSEPTTVVITDTEKYLLHLPAEFDKAEDVTGKPLHPYPNLYESLKTGKMHRQEVEAKVLGFPYIVTWNPVIDNNKVVGLLITTSSTEKTESLRKMAVELANAVEQMKVTTEQTGKASEVIAEKIQEISGGSETIMKMVEEVFQIIKLIQGVANQSKILGLNASIEAARAGEFGKGFMVVANEIRRMADQSKESSVHIIEFLNKVNEAINQNNLSIQEIAAMSEEHSASIQELNSAYSVITSASEDLLATGK